MKRVKDYIRKMSGRDHLSWVYSLLHFLLQLQLIFFCFPNAQWDTQFFCLSGVPLFSDAIKGPLYVICIHTCTVTSTWHPVVVYRYPRGKLLTMQLRWEIKLVLFFMLKESCGPEVMDNLTKVMQQGWDVSCRFSYWLIFRSLVGKHAGCYFQNLS